MTILHTLTSLTVLITLIAASINLAQAAAVLEGKEEWGSRNADAACSRVVTVTNLTFNDLLNDTTKHVFLRLFAPWGGHCKHMAPQWGKLANIVHGCRESLLSPSVGKEPSRIAVPSDAADEKNHTDSNEFARHSPTQQHCAAWMVNVTIAEIDGIEYEDIGRVFSRNAYPTLLLFRRGRPPLIRNRTTGHIVMSDGGINYNGHRDAISMSTFLESHSRMTEESRTTNLSNH